MILCVFTLKNWRAIKARLALAGIHEPLTFFKTLHDLLDVAEFMWSENMDSEKLNELHETLYKVDAKQTKLKTPELFSRESEMSGFESLKANVSAARSGGIKPSRIPAKPARRSPSSVSRGRRR